MRMVCRRTEADTTYLTKVKRAVKVDRFISFNQSTLKINLSPFSVERKNQDF